MKKFFVLPEETATWNKDARIESIYHLGFDKLEDAEKKARSFTLQYGKPFVVCSTVCTYYKATVTKS